MAILRFRAYALFEQGIQNFVIGKLIRKVQILEVVSTMRLPHSTIAKPTKSPSLSGSDFVIFGDKIRGQPQTSFAFSVHRCSAHNRPIPLTRCGKNAAAAGRRSPSHSLRFRALQTRRPLAGPSPVRMKGWLRLLPSESSVVLGRRLFGV